MQRQDTLNRNRDQPTTYGVLRLQNCKDYAFRKGEIYPSINPPVASCGNNATNRWLSKFVNETGCGTLDPKILTNLNKNAYGKQDVTKSTQESIDGPRTARRYLNHPVELSQRKLDYSQLTPYDLMRMLNCKMAKVQEWETYPSIRPPISRCSAALTAQWMADSMRDSDCGRPFDMEHDDIVEVWKQSPNKDTLGYYGVGSDIHKPEAVVFNQLISECLKRVMPEATKDKKATTIPPDDENVKKPSKKDVLNRLLLKSKIDRMPTVQEALDASKALTWLHCPHLLGEKYPFLKGEPHVRPQAAFGIKKLVPKPKHGLRRKHLLCKLPCVLPDNACTEYEYRKDPKSYKEFCRKEMERLKAECEEEFVEPRNYSELYPHLVTCFEKSPHTKARKPKTRSSKSEGQFSSEDMDGLDGEGVDGEGVDGEGAGGKGAGGKGASGKGAGGEGAGGDAAQRKKRDGSTDKDKKSKSDKGKKHFEKSRNKAKPEKSLSKDILNVQDKPSKISITNEKPLNKDDKNTRRKQQKPKRKSKVLKTETNEKCPCELCHFMKRLQRVPDSPLIQQMKKEQKRRELLDYYKGMCIRDRMKFFSPKYPAPQHKCDAIQCDDSFCSNQKFGEYCDCLNAMQHLQKLLDPKNCMVRNLLISLKNRICQRICGCL
ncbi:uncharacterized protein [Drosophila virilis]|uniref:Uncharacterized protein, isoform C n=1 Tax=Drosophila virilis TaxID=7244 RepID=B4LUP4_DROVI|nr:uncharacterized protein LOC6628834 isoform X1 [Drosophila virilis]EDW64230.2 uncharacterized protein Dvir_GJ17350, isoform C [Drosophila virilis]